MALRMAFALGALLWTASGTRAVTFTVTTTDDTGAGTLRQAILDANLDTDPDTIAFSVGGGGAQTITPASALPNVTSPVTIDGTTQPGFAGTSLIEKTGPAKRKLGRASKALAQLSKTLRSRKAKTVTPPLRDELTGSADGIRGDVGLVRIGLVCG